MSWKATSILDIRQTKDATLDGTQPSLKVMDILHIRHCVDCRIDATKPNTRKHGQGPGAWVGGRTFSNYENGENDDHNSKNPKNRLGWPYRFEPGREKAGARLHLPKTT